jgi:hypothetical protein
MSFKEMIPVFSENHTIPKNTKYTVTDCQSWWYIHLPPDFKGLNTTDEMGT